jgi:hypothetical protein
MESDQFPKYPRELEDDIGALSDYLFEKYNDVFDVFYLNECDDNFVDKSCVNYALINESENEVIQNL